MRVELVYALAGRYWRLALGMPEGSTVGDALHDARAQMGDWPEEALSLTRVAIFGRETTPEAALRAGDRLELLRPLQRDPKDTRRLRAEREPLKRGRVRP
jgi:hypothetical protein